MIQTGRMTVREGLREAAAVALGGPACPPWRSCERASGSRSELDTESSFTSSTRGSAGCIAAKLACLVVRFLTGGLGRSWRLWASIRGRRRYDLYSTDYGGVQRQGRKVELYRGDLSLQV